MKEFYQHLMNNIKDGNSLIDTDFYDNQVRFWRRKENQTI